MIVHMYIVFIGCLQAFIAALLHYLFASAFHWMLCEGVFLYLHDITVFGNKLRLLLSWVGVSPLISNNS